MFWELIAIGSMPFWLILAAALVLEFIWVGREQLIPVIAVPFIWALSMVLLGSFKVSTLFTENWKMMLYGFAVYVVGGIVFATIKWAIRSRKRGRIYAKCLEDWAEDNMPEGTPITSVNDIPTGKKLDFFRTLCSTFKNHDDSDEHYGRVSWSDIDLDNGRVAAHERSQRGEMATHLEESKENKRVADAQKKVLRRVLSSPRDIKDKWAIWAMAWPVCIFTSFVFDFLYDFWNWLRMSLTGIYVQIAKASFGKYRKDFDSVKVEREID